MTTETQTHAAAVGQFNVIRSLTKQIFGVDNEWTVLDAYQTEDILTFRLAGDLIDALHVIKGIRGTNEQRKTWLATLMAGEKLPDGLIYVADTKALIPPPAEPDPPVDQLLEGDIDGGSSTTDVTEPSTKRERSSIDAYRQKHMDLKPFTGRHGTKRAFKYHQAAGEEPCEKCKKLLQPVEVKAAPMTPSQKPIDHGTFRGYGQHKRSGEAPCGDCVEAARRFWRENPSPKRTALRQQKAKSHAKPSKPKQPKTVEIPIARNSAQQQSAVSAEFTELFTEFWDRLWGHTFEFLASSLPAKTTQPFPKERQEQWLNLARTMFDVRRPDKEEPNSGR